MVTGNRTGAWLLCAFVLVSILGLGCGNQGDPFGIDFEQTLAIDNVNPANNSVGVSIHTLVSISFPVAVNRSSITASNIVLQDNDGKTVASNIVYEPSTRIATLRPLNTLAGNTSYQLVVHNVRSSDGTLFRSQTFSFSTGSDDPGGAPEVAGVTPLPGQQELPANTVVTVTFSEPMDKPSVETAFTISNGVTGTFTWDAAGRIMTFTPGAPLISGTRFVVTILPSARDAMGTPLRTQMSWYFQTATVADFRVLDTVPQNGATTVPANTDLRFVFSEPVDKTTVVTNFSIDPVLTVAADRFSYDQNDQVIIYDPPNNLAAGTVVRATWSTDLMSVTSQTLELPYTLTFTIEAVPPFVTSADPATGTSQVESNKVVRFTFSEPLDTTSVILGTSFNVEQPSGTPVAGAITLESNDRVVAFTPTSGFVAGANAVTVTAVQTIRDLGGTPMTTDAVSVFTIDDTPPGVTLTVPAAGATDVVPNNAPTVIIEFSEPVNQAAVEGSFTIAPSGSGGVFGWPSATRLQYTTTTPLTGATLHTVSFTITDLAGNSSPGSFTFTTDDDPPNANLTVTTSGGAMTLDSNLTFTFNEPMRRQTIEDAFSYTDGTNTFDINDGTATWTPNDTYPNVLVFDPTNDFTASRNYTISVTSGAQDVGGLPLTPAFNATVATTSS